MSDGLKLIRAIAEQQATAELREVDPSLFLNDEVAVYQFVLNHFREYNEMPSVDTIVEETGTSMPMIREPVAFYLDRCYDRKLYESVRSPFNDLRTALMENNPEQIRELISQLTAAARVETREHTQVSMAEMRDEVHRLYLQNHFSYGLSGVSCGWERLDRQTDGFQNGDFIVIVARPEVGKTHLLVNMARQSWMAGKKVLFVSMEMTLRQIANRFYAHHAGVDPGLLRSGRLSNRGWLKVQEAMDEMQGDNRFQLYAGNFKGKKVSEIDILTQELTPDVVYIDGMYIMEADGAPPRTDRISKVAYLADEIKQMAIKRNRPIVCTSQFSREAGKGGRGGGLEQIGFSDAIGQHASLAIAIKMPKHGKGERPDKRIIETLKGREGEFEKFAIDFKFSPLSFEQCPESVQETFGFARASSSEDAEDGEGSSEETTTDFMEGDYDD